MDKTRALVWMLRAPSASGGKIYVTLVVDSYVLFGWGREDQGVPGLQFKYLHFSDPAAAQQGALLKTEAKEKRGYEMAIPPRVRSFGIHREEVITRLKLGSAEVRQDLVSDAIQVGVRIA